MRKTRERLHRIGDCVDRYHQLFVNRISREGRFKDFNEERRKVREETGCTWKQSWFPAARRLGFISKADEVERYERYMLEGSRVKMSEELDAIREELAQEPLQSAFSALPDAADIELPEDVKWVYTHQAMVRKPNKDGVVDLTDADYDGAPTRGAIGLLMYALGNRREFYKMVMTHLSRKDVSGGDDKALEDDNRDIKEIENMLSELR